MKFLLAALVCLVSCGPKNRTAPTAANQTKDTNQNLNALTNKAAPFLAFTGATIMTAEGDVFENGLLVTANGSVHYVGPAKAPPSGAKVIDATGMFLTPGIIDTHSHLGVYASPGDEAHSDGNEMTAPVTAQVKAKYGYWPQDPGIVRARASGVTTALILPGSANLIGGEGFTVIMRPGPTTEDVAFPGAPRTLKMACGENPKRVYGEKGGPMTRMGVYAAFRQAFGQARDRKRTTDKADTPSYDAKLDTLASVLAGDVLVQIHCYRASEIREMVAIADEFDFKIRSFHHALGAYKVRDVLTQKGIAINTWADWWGFKLEAFDGIPMNAALFHESGGRAVIHSDSAIGIQRLNQEVAKVLYEARAKGINISDDEALTWITRNAAWVLGLEKIIGSLKVGKRADVVLWDRHPFSTYATPQLVLQGGEIVHQVNTPRTKTDFEVGNSFGATP